jgi:hypothetical protein
VIFLDGLGGSTLDRGIRDGQLPFLARLLGEGTLERTSAFSGLPSTTTAFQAGLFYGLRHPDIPGFSWYDKQAGRPVFMARPEHAAWVEHRLQARVGPGLFHHGTTYLSILGGGARNYGSTAGLWPLISGPRLPPLIPGDFVGGTWVHLWTAARVLLRALTETPFLLGDIWKFGRWTGKLAFEGNHILHHLFVANLLQEMGRSQVMFDLVRGVPRMFHCLHDYDEAAHRRGTVAARETLGRIDRRVEQLVSVAAAAPDPPDVWVLTDHGQIPAIPFEDIFGCTIAEWLSRPGDDRLSTLVQRNIGARASTPSQEPPRVIDSGNYCHVYLGGDRPLTAKEVVERHGDVLARALGCPGIGLVGMRTPTGAVAFAGSRRVDPDDPSSLPRGVNPAALRVFLEDLPHTPSAGDMVLFGSWIDDACVAFTREFSSHGGLSPEETSIFLLHPRQLPVDLSHMTHAAELHSLFSSLYGEEPTDRT